MDAILDATLNAKKNVKVDVTLNTKVDAKMNVTQHKIGCKKRLNTRHN